MSDHRAATILYAPDYYCDFKCIADRCRHSCCIDWEICIDENTCSKYKQIETIRNTITECEDGSCFVLTENGRCPHLNDSGLCKIILSHGEDFLSDICKNHPRFFNEMSGRRIEASLGIVCEEACRLILENEKPFSLSEIEATYDEDLSASDCSEDMPPNGFDPLPQRDHIIATIESPQEHFDDKLSILKKTFGIFELYTSDEWLDRFLALEILDADWECVLRSVKSKRSQNSCVTLENYGKYYARLLTYFVYRHVSIAENMDNLRARLAFSILSVEMIRYLFEADTNPSMETLIDYARRYSAEIEYSEDNTFELIFEFERRL